MTSNLYTPPPPPHFSSSPPRFHTAGSGREMPTLAEQQTLFMTPQPISLQQRPPSSIRDDGGVGLDSSTRKPTLNELERKVAALEQENFDLKLRFFYLRDERARKSNSKKNTGTPGSLPGAESQEAEEERESAAERLYHLTCLLQEKEAEAEQAAERLGELNRRLLESEGRYRHDVSLLQEQNKLLSLELSDLSDRLEVVTGEQARAREREGLRLVELEEQLSIAKEKTCQHEEAMVSCGKQLGAYMKRLRELEEAAAAKDREADRQRESIKYLELALKDLERKYSKAVEEIKTKSEAAEQLSQAEQDVASLQEQLAGLTQQLEGSRQQADEAQARAQTLQTELSSFQSEAQSVAQMEAFEIQRLQDEVRQVRDELGLAEGKEALLEEALVQQVHDYKVLRGQAEEQLAKEGRIIKELKRWEGKARALQADKEALTERVRELEQRLSLALDKHHSLQDKYQHCQRELSSQQGLVGTLQASLNAVTQHHHHHCPPRHQHPSAASASTPTSSRRQPSPRTPSSLQTSSAASSATKQPPLRRSAAPSSSSSSRAGGPAPPSCSRKRRHAPPPVPPPVPEEEEEEGYDDDETSEATGLEAQQQQQQQRGWAGLAKQQLYHETSGARHDELGGRASGTTTTAGGGQQDSRRASGTRQQKGEGQQQQQHRAPRRPAAPPHLPSPQAILSMLRRLRSMEVSGGERSGLGADFIQHCLSVLGEGEREGEQEGSRLMHEGEGGGGGVSSSRRSMDPRNVEECKRMLRYMKELEMPMDLLMAKLDAKRAGDGQPPVRQQDGGRVQAEEATEEGEEEDGEEYVGTASKRALFETTLCQVLESSPEEVRNQLESILRPLSSA